VSQEKKVAGVGGGVNEDIVSALPIGVLIQENVLWITQMFQYSWFFLFSSNCFSNLVLLLCFSPFFTESFMM